MNKKNQNVVDNFSSSYNMKMVNGLISRFNEGNMMKNTMIMVSFVCGASTLLAVNTLPRDFDFNKISKGSVSIKSKSSISINSECSTGRILPEEWKPKTFWETKTFERNQQDPKASGDDCNNMASGSACGTTVIDMNMNVEDLTKNNPLMGGSANFPKKPKFPPKPEKTETMKRLAKKGAMEFLNKEAENIDEKIIYFFKSPEDRAMDAMKKRASLLTDWFADSNHKYTALLEVPNQDDPAPQPKAAPSKTKNPLKLAAKTFKSFIQWVCRYKVM